ncbi:MAG: hypothetical protein ACPLW8_04620 [Candidatus Bathyarchaeales archaeon]
MALGGRPKEEGGHKPLKISVDDFVYNALNKVENKSKFIEETLRPILKQFDPGDMCQFVSEIYQKIAQEILQATREERYDKVAALATLALSLEDYRKLCTPNSETYAVMADSEYPRKVTVGGGWGMMQGGVWQTTHYRIIMRADNKLDEKAALAYGHALINSWLTEKITQASVNGGN